MPYKDSGKGKKGKEEKKKDGTKQKVHAYHHSISTASLIPTLTTDCLFVCQTLKGGATCQIGVVIRGIGGNI